MSMGRKALGRVRSDGDVCVVFMKKTFTS